MAGRSEVLDAPHGCQTACCQKLEGETTIHGADLSPRRDVKRQLIRNQKDPLQGVMYPYGTKARPNDVLELSASAQSGLFVIGFRVGNPLPPVALTKVTQLEKRPPFAVAWGIYRSHVRPKRQRPRSHAALSASGLGQPTPYIPAVYNSCVRFLPSAHIQCTFPCVYGQAYQHFRSSPAALRAFRGSDDEQATAHRDWASRFRSGSGATVAARSRAAGTAGERFGQTVRVFASRDCDVNDQARGRPEGCAHRSELAQRGQARQSDTEAMSAKGGNARAC